MTVLERIATRDGFGKSLLENGGDLKIIVFGCDLTVATNTNGFAKKFPKRFCEVGIQEQNAIGMAAGLAIEGFRPVVPSFGSFITGRAYEQIMISLGYNDVGALIVGTHSGLAIGKDGQTQMGITDINVMRGIPRMEIFQPADAIEARQITDYLLRASNLAYLRLSRTPSPFVLPEDYKFEFNKAKILRGGKNLIFIASGDTVYNCLEASKELYNRGDIDSSVINVSTLKPIDEETILDCARKVKGIVIVEDHSTIGGLATIVSEVITKYGVGTRVKSIGIEGFGESGDPKDLYEKHGMNVGGIIKTALNFYENLD
ncbi:MAG: transketolase C-terminal domain-containing protein [archaeon]